MSAYPELKSEPIIIEETNAMYPKLPNEQPPAYTAQPMVPIGAPPTLCAQCTNTVVVPVAVSSYNKFDLKAVIKYIQNCYSSCQF